MSSNNHSSKKHVNNQRKSLLLPLMGGILLFILLAPQFIVRHNHRYSYSSVEQLTNSVSEPPMTAIVFGGGIRNESPAPVLEQRLLAAKTLYDKDIVDTIILSGDLDTFEGYDEPSAMKNYLLTAGIPNEVLIKDNFGFSTYESCERARKVFGLDRVIAVTQAGHLDRATYLCRSFGIETYGYSAERAGTRLRAGQLMRELGSNIKAVFNVYFVGENTNLSE